MLMLETTSPNASDYDGDIGKYKFQKRQGTTGSLDGHFYEIDLLILGKLRGNRDTNKFYLATNIDGLGAFDDVVMRYWKNGVEEEKSTSIFLQAKHVENSKKDKITIDKFINPKKDKFYLGKYFFDYLNSRERFNNKSEDPVFQGNFQELDLKYIIYTNAILDERFDENRKIDTDNSIFSTKSKEDKNKAFKFSLDDKNHDVIAMLESVSSQERIKLLAKALVSCISGKLKYHNMMGNALFSTYHVFLAKNVIDVGEEIKEDGKKNKYREGKINHNFLDIDDKNLFKKLLKEEVLYGYAKNVIFNEKSSSWLDDVSERHVLVNKVVKSLKSSKKVNEDVIEKLGGTVIILDTQNKQLKFADQEKIKDESGKQLIRDLESKFSKLADYKIDIPYELVKKTLKEQTEKETLKLHVSFGNINPTFKKPGYLIQKLIELFENYKTTKIIKLDDNVVGHGKSLTDGDIKNIGKLVGNLLIFEEKEKMLKLACKGSVNGDTLKFITTLKSKAQSRDLDIFSYRFDIKVKNNFPRETLVSDDEDRTNVKEFLSKLEVFTGQASDQELREIIKDQIRDLYKLTRKEVEENVIKIRDKAANYWREGDYYLEKNDHFFASIDRVNIEFNVKKPVYLFSGREKELSDLHNKIQSSSKNVTAISQIISISGLGGIGKTELARRYIQACDKTCYDNNIIWVDATDHVTLTNSFYRLATDILGISTKNSNGENMDIKSVVQEVYNFFAKRKSLFIFDNAEKSENFIQFLPLTLSYNNKPYVLITSRIAREEWEQWGVKEGITLDTFTEEDAISFVKKSLNIDERSNSQDNDIRKLAIDVLYKFPLAISQAVAHIKEENRKSQFRGKEEYTIMKYLKGYEKGREKLLNSEAFKSLDNNYDKTTFTTWKVTVDKIKVNKEYGKLALKILDIIAYFAPENIPVESFFLKLTKDDEEKLWNAVEILNRYSMIKLDQGKAIIHGLVQEVTRVNLMSEKREKETLRSALELIKGDDLEENAINPKTCIFYPCTKDGQLGNIEIHAIYIWSYASKYSQLIEDFYSTYGKNGNAPINLFAMSGKKEAIECILKNMQEDKLMKRVNDYNQVGYAPIHSAAFHGHKEIVEYFIKKQGVGVDFITNDAQNTPTFVATLGNQLHIVQYLVGEQGADPNNGGKYGTYAIHFAALYARKDFVEYLGEKGADILCKDNMGNNVLHSALLHLIRCKEHLSDTEEILKYFLTKNPDLLKHQNSMGMAPLHFAAQSGSARIVKMFLDHSADDADINAKSHINPTVTVDYSTDDAGVQERHIEYYDEGYTPLHIAAKENDVETAKVLLKHGAIYSAFNDRRCTPLDIAKRGSDVENLLTSINKSFKATERGKKDELDSLLQEKDSDVLEAILNARNRQGKKLMLVACSNRDKYITNLLLEKLIISNKIK